VNLYNGSLWAAGFGALRRGASPPGEPGWASRNKFDREIRDTLRLDSQSDIDSARDASDAFMYASILAPFVLGVGDSVRRGDCDRGFELFAEASESAFFTLFVTEATKILVARERPSGSGENRRRSFFSQHASLAAAGAGVMCAQSNRERIWGDRPVQRALPCGMGAALAVTTGMLRLAGDKHWATDVLMGWTVGALIGYFDVPGPFDLLRFSARWKGDEDAVQGVVLPRASDGTLGAQVAVRF
jgi:hypothetical protein